jgi:hypothetical protein
MTKTAFLLALIVAALTNLPAHAQQQVFVSIHGLDSNPCTVTQPCRTFQQAYTTVQANGEIDVLDPGDYGPLTISQSISIQGHGFSGISVTSSINAVTITSGVINLNGLLIDGNGVGQSGIAVTGAGTVTIENCLVRGFAGVAIIFSGPGGNFNVANTLVYNSGGGIYVQPIGDLPGSGWTAVFDRVEASYNSGNGIFLIGSFIPVSSPINATVVDSVATNNGNDGFRAQTMGGSPAVSLMLARSVAAYNTNAGVSAVGATVRVTKSTITGNGTGLSGPIVSFGDNANDGNTTNGAPSSTVALQ